VFSDTSFYYMNFQVPSHITTDRQSISLSVCLCAESHFRTHDHMLVCCQTIAGLVVMGCPIWQENGLVWY